MFNAREDNELWLISGQRRLEAWEKLFDTPIPAIVCDDYDSLFQALLTEQDEADPSLTKPMTWRNKIEFGQILRGVAVFMRFHRKNASNAVPGCSTSSAEVYRLMGCADWQWRGLRTFASVTVRYDGHSDVLHDPDLANQLLDKLDAGAITVAMARDAYTNRPNRVKAPPVRISAKAWRESVESLIRSVELTTNELEDMLLSPNADIGPEEFESFVSRLRDIRRSAGRSERHAHRKSTESR